MVNKQACLGLTPFMYVQDYVMLNYHYTSRPQTRGNQLCKLRITIMYD